MSRGQGGFMRRTSGEDGFGAVLITLHWFMAALIIAMFFMGRFMTGLVYTHPWYHLAPYIHKSIGLIVFTLLVIRIVWILTVKRPIPLPMPPLERIMASVVQKSFYVFLFGITLSGYLIPTADGRGVEFFGLFTVPAVISGLSHQEDMAGEVHYLLAWLLMFFLLIHCAGALKHHFMDRDETLLRMLGLKRKK